VTVEQQAMIADPYIAALMLLAILALQGGRPAAAAASATLAALIKPQALALVPLIVMLTMRRASRGQQLTAVIVGAVTGLAVVLPFVGDGTWPELFAAVRAMAGLHANTQNSADNLWTLLPVWRIPGQVVGPFGAIPDNTPVLAGLSYRDVGLLAFGSLQVFTLSAVWRRFSPRHVAQGAAVLGLGFFLLNTRMHVNYVFLAFPFLCALAGTRQPGARLVLACVTLACIVDWQDALPWAIHRANAALYATSFVTLCLASGLRRVVGAVRARLDGCTAHPVSEPPLSPPEIRAAPGRPAS
jgi:hypothetical protein